MYHAVHAPLHGVQLPSLSDELHQQLLLLFLASASAADSMLCHSDTYSNWYAAKHA